VIDLDEELYRKGEWKLRLYGIARTPFESNYIQGGKMLIEEVSEEEVKHEIALHVIELMEKSPKTVFLLGAGTTVEGITKRLGLEKTLLGIDAVQGKKVIASDLNERGFLELLSKHKDVKLVLSPIGAQGFILGRGNLQISPVVIRKIGIANIIVISTPSKLMHTPTLRVDTGDEGLDGEFKRRNLFVINGYHSVCLRPVG
jgi:predicted polyphosphate/ATP-dependent NAD kinase